MPLKLIVIYAAYGDTLLLQTPDNPPRYWLIDGGPIKPSPTSQEYNTPLNAYYQYLKRALQKYCPRENGVINNLAGIIVTHPDSDHMDGINRLLRENDIRIPDDFRGPIILNSTFFRPGNEPFEYRLIQFLDEVDNRGLGLSEVADPLQPNVQPDQDIPFNMKNGSLARLYKMVHCNVHGEVRGTNRIPYPQPANHTWGRHDLDKSTQNWSSTITMWHDPSGGNALIDLVTTGDGLPSYILKRMRLVPGQGPIPNVGIFKVPHHGSEYNNQWADNPDDYVNSGGTEHERKFFFCLTMLALQYGDLALRTPPSPPANVLTMNSFKDGVLRGSPMLDWTVENKTTAPDFEMSIQQLSNSVCTYLELFVKAAKVDSQSFDLTNALGLRDFADALVTRYNNRMLQIIDNGRIVAGTSGASRVTVSFNQKAFKPWFMKNIQVDALANPKYFETLFSCLDSNALDDLRKARLVRNFYSKFSAANYVISGNRFPHGHPKSSVLAGLMAHLILTVQGTTNPRRIFVTDGASIVLDYVYDLVKSLLSNLLNPPPPGEWNQKVRIYYLATDFLAEIPVDLSHVDGVNEIDFSAYATKDNEDYLTYLHNQFMKAKPYDMPRAAISHTSTFRITIRSNRDPTQRYLDMDATGNLLLAQNDQPLFNMRYIDHNTANVDRWTYKTDPHFELFTDRGRSHPIPDLVFFLKPNNTDPTHSDSLVYQDLAVGKLKKLHLDNGVISFKAGGATSTMTTVQFQRNLGV